jgi:hypothetical protein
MCQRLSMPIVFCLVTASASAAAGDGGSRGRWTAGAFPLDPDGIRAADDKKIMPARRAFTPLSCVLNQTV